MSDIQTVHGVKVNFAIPHTMTSAGLVYLGRLAQSVPENGLIVEIGPLFGSSTWVLAQNSKPSVRVISVDTWEPAQWIDRVESEFPGCRSFSKETFEHYVSDCDNVTAVQGWSPQIVEPLELADIDMFFDDATHGDPGFTESMEYYIPRVRPQGIVCGDDYAGGWPDIVQRVDEIGDSWNAEAEITGRVWSLIKPDAEGASSPRVADRLGPISRYVTITTEHASGKERTCSPNTWAGALHKPDAITSVTATQVGGPAGSELQLQLRGADGATTAWVSAGQVAALAADNPLVAIRAQLAGDDAGNASLRLQVNSVNDRGKGGNSKDYRSGDWAEIEAGATLAALRLHFV